MLMKQGHDNIDAFDTSKKTYCADPCAAGSRRRRGFWVLWTTSRRGGGVRASRPAGAVVSILNCHPRRGRGPAPRPRSASRPRLRASATIRVAAAAPRHGHDPRRGRGPAPRPRSASRPRRRREPSRAGDAGCVLSMFGGCLAFLTGFFGIHAAYVYPAPDFDAFESEMVKVAEAA